MRNLQLSTKRQYSFAIICLILFTMAYFYISYRFLQPNILTWWSDEYEYLSQAKNFALFSNLETSFYTGKAVIYGNFPSFGYHPILFSFILGVFIKIFRFIPNIEYFFNYILLILTLTFLYFFSREKISKKLTIWLFLLIAFFPVIIIYLNTQSPEIFLISVITASYIIFNKNAEKFNFYHFILIILFSIASVQRITYLLPAIIILIYLYIRWSKTKRAPYIIPSLIFFISIYFLLYKAFAMNIQIYPAEHENSIYFYLKSNGFSSISDPENLLVFFKFALNNLKLFLVNFINYKSSYFFFHWLYFLIIFSNIFLFFKTKDRNLKKELSFILLPQLLLILISSITYPPTDIEHFSHLRPVFGFIILNIYYLILFFREIRFKIRIMLLVFFIALFFLASFYVIKPFYLKKISDSSGQIKASTQTIKTVINKYRFKDSLIIGGIDGPDVRDAIISGNKNDKFIRLNQFPLNDTGMKNLLKKINIDMWIVKKDSNFITEYLNTWPYIYTIKSNDAEWFLYLSEKAYVETERIYIGDRDEFYKDWTPINNCKFIVENNALVLDAFGDDPSFENKVDIDFKKDKNHYLEVVFESPQDSYFQLFYRQDDQRYNEKNSIKINTSAGKNRIFIRMPEENIRVDLGTGPGKYIIRRFNIFSSGH